MKIFLDTEFIEDGKTIDLISVGMIDATGTRKLYLVSSDFDETKANDWVKENVLTHIPPTQKRRTREEIRDFILDYVGSEKPEFWGYYADYDWVVLCQLFGRMIDLPKDWPFYCNDLKQLFNAKGYRAPPQTGTEHHALADAEWVRQQYMLCVSA